MTRGPGTGPACVVGAGTMGAGIALVLARVGDVRLVARRSGSLEAAAARIARSLETLEAHGLVQADDACRITSRIVYTTSLAEGLGGADLVLESIGEDLDAKHALLAEIEELVGEQTVIATNTSGLSIDALAAPLRVARRFAGLHWLNPA